MAECARNLQTNLLKIAMIDSNIWNSGIHLGKNCRGSVGIFGTLLNISSISMDLSLFDDWSVNQLWSFHHTWLHTHTHFIGLTFQSLFVG